ncbi:retrovirus-related Pol polyprotein from transposon TNT 1-94 [Nephila pilipes]|uniref:Retrovirus-related Pol polyprotein from transposon TNT 1-94 n=1 Tax=Nephila pilipes TaxID=299642 RepID=A0A8X6UQ68_NEPPI|nr:retrovirus-related Pol polyprotein from transposon TNT 1-94 [Nephila pilipes]
MRSPTFILERDNTIGYKWVFKRFLSDGANPNAKLADHGTITSSETITFPGGKTIPYTEAIGSLVFLSITIRADIAFAGKFNCRFQIHLGQMQWRHIFRYMKGTATYGIEYSPLTDQTCRLVGYSDADFDKAVDKRKSTSGLEFELRYGPVTWCSSKKPTVSTTKVEYKAASTTVKEI